MHKMAEKESNENPENKVLARVIIEMLGAPKEHIEKTLKRQFLVGGVLNPWC